MKKLIAVFVLSLFIQSASLQAQLPYQKGLESVNRNTAEAIIGFLASDELQGREAGTNSSRTAAVYIESYLKLLGISPCGESYYQPFEAKGLALRNVLGKIEGRNADEYVIVGAHYDHLGIDTNLEGDQIYNGADDNASGVSAVLQIAKAFLVAGQKPERTLIFAFWDGEEKRMLGSNFFVDSFADMAKVKGYLNFDMIGRNHYEEKPNHVKYLYTSGNGAFKEWIERDIKQHGFDLEPEYETAEKLSSGSDNVPFSRYSIPTIWYHTDGHPDYHKPGDHADKLNWEKLTDITKAAFLSAWKLANEEAY